MPSKNKQQYMKKYYKSNKDKWLYTKKYLWVLVTPFAAYITFCKKEMLKILKDGVTGPNYFIQPSGEIHKVLTTGFLKNVQSLDEYKKLDLEQQEKIISYIEHYYNEHFSSKCTPVASVVAGPTATDTNPPNTTATG